MKRNITRITTIVIVGYIIFRILAPFGLVASYNLEVDESEEMSNLIEPLQMTDYIVEETEGSIKTISMVEFQNENIKFKVRATHTDFEKGTLKIKYKVPDRVNRIDFKIQGGLQESVLPLYNRDFLSTDWPVIHSDQYSLWQRKQTYDRLEDFFEKPPLSSADDPKIVSDGIEIPQKVKLEEYTPLQEYQEYSVVLRGSQTLYTYINNEILDYTFTFRDLNRYPGADEGTIKLINNKGEPLEVWRIKDDDITIAEEISTGKPRDVRIYAKNLPSGVYKLEIDISDTLITQIKTKQSKFVFHKQIFLAGNISYGEKETTPSQIFTDSSQLYFRTDHIFGQQNLIINNNIVTVDRKGDFINYKPDKSQGLTSIYSSQNDLRIRGNGYFALTEQAFFNPHPSVYIDYSQVSNLAQYDYVITNYLEPYDAGDSWYENKVEFEIRDWMLVEEGIMNFEIHAPGLSKSKYPLYIDHLEIKLEKGRKP